MSSVISFYGYKNCSTCKKAKRWLEDHGVDYENFEIRETPPSDSELKKAMNQVDKVTKVFNTSGMDYRQLNLKDKLPEMDEGEKIKLLRSNGNLVKRPFVVTPDQILIGFKESEWEEHFG